MVVGGMVVGGAGGSPLPVSFELLRNLPSPSSQCPLCLRCFAVNGGLAWGRFRIASGDASASARAYALAAESSI